MGIEAVDPAICRMWDLHDRLGEEIDADSCRSLIRSLQRHGQRHPVLARPNIAEHGYKYELVYGARRLFATRYLGMTLLVDVREFDDRVALIEMDVENRVRKDISPYERGLSYRRWLRAGHFASQTALARDLGVSEAQISRLLRYADLPAAVVAAFRSPRDIREEWAVALAKICSNAEERQKVVRRARGYTGSRRVYPPQAIYELLIDAGNPQRRSRNDVVKTSGGSPFMQISYRAKSVHLILPRATATAAFLAEVTERIRTSVEDRERERGPVLVNTARLSSAAPLDLADLSRYGGRRRRAADN